MQSYSKVLKRQVRRRKKTKRRKGNKVRVVIVQVAKNQKKKSPLLKSHLRKKIEEGNVKITKRKEVVIRRR